MAVTESVYLFFKKLMKILTISGINWVEATDDAEMVISFRISGMGLEVIGGSHNETGIWDYAPKTNVIMIHYAGKEQVFKIIVLDNKDLLLEDIDGNYQRSFTNENYLLPESYSPEFNMSVPVKIALAVFVIAGVIVPVLAACKLL